MKALPSVTIGICVRNCVSTIREAIESIIVQEYPHNLMEVIFVDDGSIDDTLAIIKKYAIKMDMKVRIFHHKWKGLGFSRNIVVNSATGKYIVWVDGDTMLSKNYIKELVELMEKNPKIAIAKGIQGLIYTKSLAAFLENILHTTYDFEEKNGTLKRFPGTGGSIYRLEAIRNIGGFDNNLQGVGEDQDVAYRIASSGWSIKKAHVLYYERHRPSWKALWDEYFWWGSGMSDVYRKHSNLIHPYKMLPLLGFLAGIIYSIKAYKIIKKKIVFLLPFHFIYKSTAWCLGFLNEFLKNRKMKPRKSMAT